MTEQEWLTGSRPDSLVDFFRDKPNERKLRLYACACCRRIWHLLEDEESRQAVETAERYADGMATNHDLHVARRKAHEAADRSYRRSAPRSEEGHVAYQRSQGAYAASDAADKWDDGLYMFQTFSCVAAAHDITGFIPVLTAATQKRWYQVIAEQQRKQSDDLRDIVGNPFRPIAIDPAWLAWNDHTIPKLAQAIYDDRAFDRLPILADALEDAGCTNEDILSHCRGPGPHVRGCWVIDLILDKE